MTDPEVTYRSLITGNPDAPTAAAEALAAVGTSLDAARTGIADAAGVPVWSGGTANAYCQRVATLTYGVAVNREAVARARSALTTAASSYVSLERAAEGCIAIWRSRPSALPAIIEEIHARVVNGALVGAGRAYNRNLAAIDAVLNGDEVDVDELDEDTRKWVEQGEAKNDAWRDDTGGGLGPLIPNTAATGDERGLTPQGLGYDPATRSLLQAYYKHGDPSVLAVIDEVTGKELTEVRLGTYGDDTSRPGHVGGVAVDGDRVYVTDSGKVYEYSLNEIRAAAPGMTVEQQQSPTYVQASSYSAFHNGTLYVGSHDGNKLYAYERDAYGSWQQVRDADGPVVIDTPDKVQGVTVRDGEFVFSTSYGRQNESSLIVQDRDTGERSDAYPFPNMSQGVVEVDGELYVTYESGSEQFDTAGTGPLGWLWGVPDSDGLWAARNMTTIPLEDLGLGGEFHVEPATLRTASLDLDDSSSALTKQHTIVDGISVQGADFGSFPASVPLATSLTTILDGTADSLKTGGAAVMLLADSLWDAGGDYDTADLAVQAAFKQLRG